MKEMKEVLKSGLADRRQLGLYALIIVIAMLIVALIALAAFTSNLRPRKETTCGDGKRTVIIDGLGTLTILPREGWKAEKQNGDLKDLKHHNIIEYTHTADVAQCSECCAQLYNIQYQHMNELGWSDIGLHYFIDKDGLVYEGRDAKKVSAAVKNWNFNLTSVAFLGNFMYDTPSLAALGAFNMLIQYIIDNDNVDRNFTIYAMCEITESEGPGKHLYDAVNDPANARRFINFRHVGHRPDGFCAKLT